MNYRSFQLLYIREEKKIFSKGWKAKFMTEDLPSGLLDLKLLNQF